MRVSWIEIVIGPVEVVWHNRKEVCAILFVEISAELYSRNLCNGVWLVCGLQAVREKIFLFYRLGRMFGVYAG